MKGDVAVLSATASPSDKLTARLQALGSTDWAPRGLERALIAPPRCRLGSITEAERAAVRANSPVGAKCDQAINRESAAEKLAMFGTK